MAKFKTKGADVKIGLTSPPTVSLGQLRDCTFEIGERDALIDATTHDTTVGIREKLDSGFREAPMLTVEFLYDPDNAQHEILRAAHAAGTTVHVLVTLPNTGNATFLFPSRVKSFGMGLPVNGVLAVNCVFEALSAETFAA